MKTIVVFRNDDPSARCDVEHERRIASIFDRYGLHQTLGVIPLHCNSNVENRSVQRPVRLDENPDMVKFLLEYVERSGSEIALHGCTHQVSRLARPSRREHFEFEGLPLKEQEELIARGTEVLEQVLGVRPCTFIAPWNRLDKNTVIACQKQGYEIVSSAPYAPVVEGIQSLGMNCGLGDFRSLIEKSRTTEYTILLIINYHSPRIRTQQDEELLEDVIKLTASSADCEVLTLSETVRRYPDLVQQYNEAGINIVAQWQVHGSDRSRSAIYERMLRKARIKNRLTTAYVNAQDFYWFGRYEEACGLTPLIDRLCKRLLKLSRFVFAAAGIIVGVVLWAFLSRRESLTRFSWYAGVLTFLITAGAVFHWYLTNKDAKRELLLAMLLNVLATILAIAVGEVVSLLHFFSH